VSTLLARAVETVQPLIQERGHQLTVDAPEAALRVNVDPVRLTQALGNILANAAKYTDPGGRIRLTAGGHGADVEIRVRDSGIGIAAELLPRLFELFTQLDHRLDRPQGGLGIGLALVRRLVEMHGGRVSAHSAGVGQGSEFLVCLPLCESAAEPAGADARSAPASVPAPGRRRILVADDNIDALESLATLLELGGHEVYSASNGNLALEGAERHRPDVALLDIGMPLLDGYEVARRIRAQPWGKAITLVALTGWGQDSDRRRSREAGFDSHLVKPLDLDRLTQLLGSLPRPAPGALGRRA
jgi:CheY-like chemotaxis protein